PMSPAYQGEPVPSMMWPFRMSRSKLSAAAAIPTGPMKTTASATTRDLIKTYLCAVSVDCKTVYAGGMCIDRLPGHERVAVATLVLFAFSTLSASSASAASTQPAPSFHATITRDDWGIAHVKGHSDADAVFGMIYAQAEDDFNRVETNYLVSLGRLA